MSKLTDDKLIKRATHAGRNLSVLAILASFGAIGLVVAAILAKEKALLMAIPAATLILITIGYWVLAVAAKRGNPSSVGSVIVVMILQFTLALVAYGITTARTDAGADAQVNMPGLIIPILVIIALVSSRNVLLELKKRDLWTQIFGSSKPSGRLCVVGSILIVIGFLGLNGSSIYAGWDTGKARQHEMQQAQYFVDMIQNEEQAFINSMSGLSGASGAEEIRAALSTVTELEQRTDAIKTAVKEGSPFGSILENYGNAVEHWKSAVTLLAAPNPDEERAQKMLILGDKLRAQAGQAFDRRYIGKQ